ncbi:MAG: hypothetical protein HPY44_07690 [Armatimonadetes bacterium]|nr:hypothetical protein [Armatimonadota bacterium]
MLSKSGTGFPAALVVVLLTGLCATSWSLGTKSASKISGYVFTDGTGPGAYGLTNGMWDAGEQGFQGVAVGLRLHFLNGPNGNTPSVLELKSTTTDANGYYEFNALNTAAQWAALGRNEARYEVYIKVNEWPEAAYGPFSALTCTTGHDDPAGEILSKHETNALKASYGNIVLAYPQVPGQVFNWPTGTFPGYRGFMTKNNAVWPEPPYDWSTGELTEYSQVANDIAGFKGDHRKHVDFGYTIDTPDLPPASIGDFVWLDKNRDNVQDPGEPGVAGAIVTLYDDNDEVIATQTTGSDGKYLFQGLKPGSYYVSFQPPAGYGFVTPNAGGDRALDSDADQELSSPSVRRTVATDLAPSEQDLTWDCGLYQLPAAIGDRVWFDLDRDGLQDSSELPVPGITVLLCDGNGDPLGPTETTDENGLYLFDGLEPGDYSITFVNPNASFGFTKQNAGDDAIDSDANVDGKTVSTTLDPGETDLTWDAGLVVLPAAIGDYVWLDANENGIQDDDEDGVSGVLVKLLDGNGAEVDSMLTDEDGFYLFDELEPGAYSVSFELPSGYSFTTQDAGDNAADSDAASDGTTVGTILFPGITDLTWDAGLVREDEDEITIEKTGGKMVGECHTIGFWKNNAQKIRDCKSGTQVTRTQYITWLNLVRDFYLDNPYKNLIPAAIPGDKASEDAALTAAFNIMSSNSNDWTSKTLKQLLACELNYVSGVFAMADGAAHSAFLRMAEEALNTPGADLETIHNLADTINNLGNASSDPTPVIGSYMAFTITVRAELSAARQVEVRDYLDSCLSFVTASAGGQFVSAGGYVKWTVPLPAGPSVTNLVLVAKITKLPAGDAGAPSGTEWVVSNEVEFEVWDQLSASVPNFQLVPASWTGSSMGSISFACHPGTIKLTNIAYAKLGDEVTPPANPENPGNPTPDNSGATPDPVVTITKAVSDDEVVVGDTIIYALKVTVENGPATVTIWDKLPTGLKLVGATPSAQYISSKRTVVWKDVTLETGDHYFLIKVKVEDWRESRQCSVEADSEARIDFTCGSGGYNCGKEKVCTLSNTAYVGIDGEVTKSNTVKVDVYRQKSSKRTRDRHRWGC